MKKYNFIIVILVLLAGLMFSGCSAAPLLVEVAHMGTSLISKPSDFELDPLKIVACDEQQYKSLNNNSSDTLNQTAFYHADKLPVTKDGIPLGSVLVVNSYIKNVTDVSTSTAHIKITHKDTKKVFVETSTAVTNSSYGFMLFTSKYSTGMIIIEAWATNIKGKESKRQKLELKLL